MKQVRSKNRGRGVEILSTNRWRAHFRRAFRDPPASRMHGLIGGHRGTKLFNVRPGKESEREREREGERDRERVSPIHLPPTIKSQERRRRRKKREEKGPSPHWGLSIVSCLPPSLPTTDSETSFQLCFSYPKPTPLLPFLILFAPIIPMRQSFSCLEFSLSITTLDLTLNYTRLTPYIWTHSWTHSQTLFILSSTGPPVV